MQNKISKRGLGLSLILVFLLSGCEQTDSKVEQQYPFSYSGSTMGTSFSIKVSQLPADIEKFQIKAKISDHLEYINKTMSTYIQGSEISLINSSRSLSSQFISPDLYQLIERAGEISELTGGAYDVTVAPLVNLWGFGPDKSNSTEPSSEAIQQALTYVGHDKLILMSRIKVLAKKIPEVSIDVSSLAKGLAVDHIATILENLDIHNYMVEIGGELHIKGKNLQGKNWRIGVEIPSAGKRELFRVLPVTDIAMATSGDYRNFFEQDGKRFSHTIDPRTGYPITHKLASVTVLSDTTMEADAWATALMVLGPEEGYKIATEQKLAVLFLIKEEIGFKARETPLFIEYTKGTVKQ